MKLLADERFRLVKPNDFILETLIRLLIFFWADSLLFNSHSIRSNRLDLRFCRRNCIISEMDLLDFVDSTTHLSFLSAVDRCGPAVPACAQLRCYFIYSRLHSAIVIVMISFGFCSDHGLDPSLRKSGIFCFYYLLL